MAKYTLKWKWSLLVSCSLVIGSGVSQIQSALGSTLEELVQDSNMNLDETFESIVFPSRKTQHMPKLILVHSMDEMQQAWGSEKLSPSAEEITRMYEKAPEGPIKERLHADQHEMLSHHKETLLKIKCVELVAKLRRLDRKIEKLDKSGQSEKAEKLRQKADEGHALVQVNCLSQR